MSSIRVLHETEDTVTISRDDWEKLQQALEDAEDRTAVAERRAHERMIGKDAARRDYLTASEALRLLNGESPVKVWREKRALSQRALAATAGISPSYLAEIETNRKSGSDGAYRKLGAVLRLPPEQLDSRQYRMRNPQFGPVVLRLNSVSAGGSPGHRGAWTDRMDFPTLADALDFIRERWLSLRPRDPRITDDGHWPIYTSDDLIREIDG